LFLNRKENQMDGHPAGAVSKGNRFSAGRNSQELNGGLQMKEFDYLQPKTIAEASELLAQYGKRPCCSAAEQT
jgi:hypothetical protein